MRHLFLFWYGKSGPWVLRSFLHTIQNFEGTLAVKSTAKNISKPLFQDYTYQGRIIGALLRIARICLGSFIYLLIAVAYLGAYAFWLAFPIICLVNMVGALAGPSYVLPPSS